MDYFQPLAHRRREEGDDAPKINNLRFFISVLPFVFMYFCGYNTISYQGHTWIYANNNHIFFKARVLDLLRNKNLLFRFYRESSYKFNKIKFIGTNSIFLPKICNNFSI